MVQCDRDCIQFDGSIILDIPKREVTLFYFKHILLTFLSQTLLYKQI